MLDYGYAIETGSKGWASHLGWLVASALIVIVGLL
jgi:hypothetical protein